MTNEPQNQSHKEESETNYLILSQPLVVGSLTPTEALERFLPHFQDIVLCEFKPRPETQFAFVGFDSLLNIKAHGQRTTLTDHKGSKELTTNPLNLIGQYENKFSAENVNVITRFLGCPIGYLSYDAIRYIEAIPDQHSNPNNIPDCDFHYFQTGIMFDLKTGEIVVSVLAKKDEITKGEAKLKNIIELISKEQTSSEKIPSQLHMQEKSEEFTADLSDAQYMSLVEKSKSYIRRGDVFQIVPSRTFSKTYKKNGIAIYKALKQTNPSPYHFFIKSNGHTVVGASPEKMACVYNNKIEIVPLAGTRPRNQNEFTEKNLENELLNDPKEIAEHMMLVDLARNDIGAVAVPGSVTVDRLAYISKYQHVMHIASDVSGHLDKHKNRIDVIRATFPAGTLSGAPKIRAMELIDELESSRRGIYGGAIIMMDQLGNMESAIAIRTGMISNHRLTLRAGAGIVHDSDPQTEADETRAKAKGFFKAVELAETGVTS